MADSNFPQPAAEWKAVLLVLDDSRDDALLLQTALRDVGYSGKILEAGGVNEALEELAKALEGEPGRAVLVADYFLPGETAQEALDAIRERYAADRVRVVITSSALSPAVTAELAGRVVSVQEKPLQWSGYLQLAEELRNMLLGR